MNETLAIEVTERKVGTLLIVGIALVPIIFVWFLLRKGYSSIARILGIGWLVASVFLVFLAGEKPAEVVSVVPEETHLNNEAIRVDSNQPSLSEKINPPKATATVSEEVRLNAEVVRVDGGRVLVSGETNLPEQTRLLVTLSNGAVGYSAQDKVVVADGRFLAGPFSQQNDELGPGHYTAKIVMPISAVQPSYVQSVIGDLGQYLTGNLVQESSVGGKIVEYSVSYKLGADESIQQAQSNYANQVSEVRKEIEHLLKAGHEMELYRNTDDLAALSVCGEKMRFNQERAKKIRDRAEMLPASQIYLKAASVDVHSCVSCSRTALEACDRVKDALDEGVGD